jgi:succinyl-diaminopimelate desuccinylase
MNSTRSIIEFLRQLIRIPSRAGVDDYKPIAAQTLQWLRERGVESELLSDAGGDPVGLYAVIDSAGNLPSAVPTYMLNATLDTAEFGDESRWTHAPTTAEISDGWLYGRGSADSKAGVSLFCHLMAELAADRHGWFGRCVLLLDLEEHTGTFAGVRRYFQASSGLPHPRGVFIGYPGNDRIVVGSRGFLRGVITVHGVAAHSGSSHRTGINAVLRASMLVGQLSALRLPEGTLDAGEAFPLPPQITVSGIEGGSGYSMIPDTCRVLVDVRLTPLFKEAAARSLIEGLLDAFNREDTRSPDANVAWEQSWPPYRIADEHPIVRALRQAAESEFKRSIPAAVVGPSNIGNYLQTLNIPATSGFGVTYRGIHALDECVEIASLEPVYKTYRAALRTLLRPP